MKKNKTENIFPASPILAGLNLENNQYTKVITYNTKDKQMCVKYPSGEFSTVKNELFQDDPPPKDIDFCIVSIIGYEPDKHFSTLGKSFMIFVRKGYNKKCPFGVRVLNTETEDGENKFGVFLSKECLRKFIEFVRYNSMDTVGSFIIGCNKMDIYEITELHNIPDTKPMYKKLIDDIDSASMCEAFVEVSSDLNRLVSGENNRVVKVVPTHKDFINKPTFSLIQYNKKFFEIKDKRNTLTQDLLISSFMDEGTVYSFMAPWYEYKMITKFITKYNWKDYILDKMTIFENPSKSKFPKILRFDDFRFIMSHGDDIKVKKKKQPIRVSDPIYLNLKLEDNPYVDRVVYEIKNSNDLCFRESSTDQNWKIVEGTIDKDKTRKIISSMFVKINHKVTIIVSRFIKKSKNRKGQFIIAVKVDDKEDIAISLSKTPLLKFIEICYYYGDEKPINKLVLSLRNDVGKRPVTLKDLEKYDPPEITKKLFKQLYDTIFDVHVIRNDYNGQFIVGVDDLYDEDGKEVRKKVAFFESGSYEYNRIPVILFDPNDETKCRTARVHEDLVLDYIISFYHREGSNYDLIIKNTKVSNIKNANEMLENMQTLPIFDNLDKIKSSYVKDQEDIPIYVTVSESLEKEGFETWIEFDYQNNNAIQKVGVSNKNKPLHDNLQIQLYYPQPEPEEEHFISFDDRVVSSKEVLGVFYGTDEHTTYMFLVCVDEAVSIISELMFSRYRDFFSNEFIHNPDQQNIIIRAEEKQKEYQLLQAALRYGYKTNQEYMMYWFFLDQPFHPDREVWAEDHRKEVNERTQGFSQNNSEMSMLKRKPSERALQGRLNVEIIYKSGKRYPGRMRQTFDGYAIIEPAKGDTMAWMCDLELVRDLTIIDLARIPHEPVRHTPKNIEWLKSLNYVNKFDF